MQNTSWQVNISMAGSTKASTVLQILENLVSAKRSHVKLKISKITNMIKIMKTLNKRNYQGEIIEYCQIG